MSRGTKLQEMEQSKTAVNANATPADAVSYTHLTLPTNREV